MKFRKLIKLGIILATFISILFWLFFKYARGSVASERHDAEEAAWNYIVRSGEIRIRLLEGSSPRH
jgi:hypothetical protein